MDELGTGEAAKKLKRVTSTDIQDKSAPVIPEQVKLKMIFRVERHVFLKSIEEGIELSRAETNDKSSPAIDSNYNSQSLMRNEREYLKELRALVNNHNNDNNNNDRDNNKKSILHPVEESEIRDTSAPKLPSAVSKKDVEKLITELEELKENPIDILKPVEEGKVSDRSAPVIESMYICRGDSRSSLVQQY